MKLCIYNDYTRPVGTIEVGTDGKLKVEASTPQVEESITDLAMHYAALWSSLPANKFKSPAPADVLQVMAQRMPVGKRNWCEAIK